MLSSFSISESIIGYMIDGSFNETTIDEIHLEIIEKLQVYDKVNLYLEDTSIESFSIVAVFKSLAFKLKHTNRFRKIAVVTDRK